MSAMTTHLDIVDAEKKIFSGLVQNVTIAGEEGSLGIYPGHTPLLTGIKPGEISMVLQNGEREVFYISGGILEIQPEVVSVLADTVIRAEDIDEEAALEASERARAKFEEAKKKSKADYQKALIQLQEASARLRAVRDLSQYTKDKY